MRKLTKAQRRKLLPIALMNTLTGLSDDALLAAHDFIHGEMEHRHGTNKRSDAGRAALKEDRG